MFILIDILFLMYYGLVTGLRTRLRLTWKSGQSRAWLDDFPISNVVACVCAEVLEMNIRP
jgi:hypothetical protein